MQICVQYKYYRFYNLFSFFLSCQIAIVTEKKIKTKHKRQTHCLNRKKIYLFVVAALKASEHVFFRKKYFKLCLVIRSVCVYKIKKYMNLYTTTNNLIF